MIATLLSFLVRLLAREKRKLNKNFPPISIICILFFQIFLPSKHLEISKSALILFNQSNQATNAPQVINKNSIISLYTRWLVVMIDIVSRWQYAPHLHSCTLLSIYILNTHKKWLHPIKTAHRTINNLKQFKR